ncbi:MAG: C40 family peptidase [Candidatus Omnitrophota bacterium]|nr:C40 family peptidase [Candidatus Omnitrophota bacterium]
MVLLLTVGCASSKSLMTISVPVADLRAQPNTTAQAGVHDQGEETQLLYGEQVRVLNRREGWVGVEAIEQQEFSHAHRWQGYPGWIPSTALAPWEQWLEPTIVITAKWAQTWHDAHLMRASPWRFALGTRLKATDFAGQRWQAELLNGQMVWLRYQDARSFEELAALTPVEQRTHVVRNAALLVGDPYYWGGRSPSGVDCSGLVNLAFRGAGVAIPRDAHEQFLRARPVTTLQPADLIFLSERSNPARIVHVMLYTGEGEIIEGPGTGSAVRRIALAQRLGRSMDQLSSGLVVDEQTVSFGSYLP